MRNVLARIPAIAFVAGAAIAVAACGSKDESGNTANTATTEMLSTETTIDGTTNDATSLDTAVGANNEVVAPANEAAAENTTAQ